MRLLLIAYEFPPSPSPQSLRWAYLTRELAGQGHDVHVLTVDLGGETPGLPDLPETVTVHRTFAGPFRGLFAARRKRNARRAAAATGTTSASAPPASRQGWKHRLSERVQSLLANHLFPDARGEWFPWGRGRLLRLLDTLDPDLVISSHEPATTLELGLLAKARGYPWIADLGDPVLAGYTPTRWRERAGKLEAQVCRDADALLVTTATARALMASRHGRVEGVETVTQGYDARSRIDDIATPAPMDAARLELLYTGSLYRFRRIDELLRAMERMPDARLNIASISLPDELLAWAARFPDRIRVLGFLPHLQALRLQREADVLVNIANDDPNQVPGKVYEYLGARRPILHLGNTDDVIARLLQRTGRGWACANDAEAIVRCLSAATTRARHPLPACSTDEIAGHSWQAAAARVGALASALAKKR